MAKWWMGAALVTLGLAGRATAQPMPPPAPMMPPGGAGPGGMSHAPFPGDPMPIGGPGFCPPGGGAPEPDSPFSLPNDGSPNAFSNEDPPGCGNTLCYFHTGWLALQRQDLGHGLLAWKDLGVNIPGVPNNVDTGNQPPGFAPKILDFNDLGMKFNNGVTATVGYREGDHAIEVTGFYLAETTASTTIASPGQLDVISGAFQPSPLGFQGNNFLWLQADRMQVSLETKMFSGEINYRHFYYRGIEWLFGARYLDFQERFSILTDDDGLTVNPINRTQIALYSVRTHNRIVGPQLGFHIEHPLVSWLAVGMAGKGCWGANFLAESTLLQRGDGFFGPGANRSTTIFSHVYEMSAWATFAINDQIRLRGGYQTLWLVGVPEAHEQTNFDPNTPFARTSNTGSIFWHGPVVELQLIF